MAWCSCSADAVARYAIFERPVCHVSLRDSQCSCCLERLDTQGPTGQSAFNVNLPIYLVYAIKCRHDWEMCSCSLMHTLVGIVLQASDP